LWSLLLTTPFKKQMKFLQQKLRFSLRTLLKLFENPLLCWIRNFE